MLFHVTPAKNRSSILSSGISTKYSIYEPRRVWVCGPLGLGEAFNEVRKRHSAVKLSVFLVQDRFRNIVNHFDLWDFTSVFSIPKRAIKEVDVYGTRWRAKNKDVPCDLIFRTEGGMFYVPKVTPFPEDEEKRDLRLDVDGLGFWLASSGEM